MTAFEEFGVMPELGAAVDEMGWTLPTDVQVEVNTLWVEQCIITLHRYKEFSSN